ncbi:PREDICTED: serine/threonine-protein kinase Nek5-like [Priapulus caudatus]|uniref:non-specific serine/threonine protein kinase n=1 Tax=Priapulus caudatus TaxID=37621 RepID=A0ABM1E7N9_PRICU|nr:PREDICTED: serine/threonine-protein kinase Nek5-like [Priapulus caudatus]
MAGKYKRLELVGSGTFGKAWLVQSKSSSKRYVIKEINVKAMPQKEREHAASEVAILSRCKHANVIRYREAFLEHGSLYIVMEFAEKGDIHQKIKLQKGQLFKEVTILNWFVQICFALEYIHGQSILHRDLKAANIFLTEDNIVKVGDFGIARILEGTHDHAQTAIGTPYYISPEICQRKPYNQKSDMWALGCVLYEIAALTYPFHGADFNSLVFKIMQGKYNPIPSVYGPLIQDLVYVLLRADPLRRPSAAQILSVENLQPHIQLYISHYERMQQHSVRPQQGRRPAAAPTEPTGDVSREETAGRGSGAGGGGARAAVQESAQIREGVCDRTNTARGAGKEARREKDSTRLIHRAGQRERKAQCAGENKENIDPNVALRARVQSRKSSLSTPKIQRKHTRVRQAVSDSSSKDVEVKMVTGLRKGTAVQGKAAEESLRCLVTRQAAECSLRKASACSGQEVLPQYDSGYSEGNVKTQPDEEAPLGPKPPPKLLLREEIPSISGEQPSQVTRDGEARVRGGELPRESHVNCKTYTMRAFVAEATSSGRESLLGCCNSDTAVADDDRCAGDDEVFGVAGEVSTGAPTSASKHEKNNNKQTKINMLTKVLGRLNKFQPEKVAARKDSEEEEEEEQLVVARLLYRVHRRPSGFSDSSPVSRELWDFLEKKVGRELCERLLARMKGRVDDNTIAFEDSLSMLGKENLMYLPVILKLLEVESQ